MNSLPTTLPAFIWHFSRPYFWPFLIFTLAPVLLIVESTVLPYALKMIVDTVATYDGPKEEIFTALAPALKLCIGSWVFMVAFFRVQEWWQCYAYPKFEADIRLAMFAYAQEHSHRYFSDHFAGSVANKISDMVVSIRNLMMLLRWRVIASASVTLATIAVMLTISPAFAAIVTLWTVAQIGVVQLFARKADKVSEQNAEDRSTLSGKIVDAFTNIANIRLFSHHAEELRYLGTYQEAERRSNQKLLLVMSNAKLATEPTTLLFLGAMFYFLIRGWQEGTVSPGDFVFVFNASYHVIWNVWLLSMELPTLFKEIGVAKQALSIVAVPHEVADAPDAPALKVTRGEIAFEGVHFHYVPGKDIFRNKNITLAAGQKVGLVGFSGSGKSTFVNLILRFFDVEAGRITIDGQDTAQVTQASLRRAIAMIPQDTSLFHRTLMENIRYGRPDATDEDVVAAAKQADCHEFIQEMQGGYEALVGERGVKLSGGQRQRIALARAILKDAPILILDEATSSLDSLTEQRIQESLKALMEGRTTIVIAHRLSTLSGMDRILVFRDGEIIEDGTHEVLLAEGGHYAQLWNMQVGGFLPERQK